jgi:hypothetical protein
MQNLKKYCQYCGALMTRTVRKTDTWFDRETGKKQRREWMKWRCPNRSLFFYHHDEIDEWKDRNYLGGTPG